MQFTVSSRLADPLEIVRRFEQYGRLNQLESVFGFLFDSPLNGGRLRKGCLTFPLEVIDELNEMGIGYSFTLTNLTAADEHLEDPLTNHVLERFHRPLNGVITADDRITEYVRRHYPDYKLRASCIYDFTDADEINAACERFDQVCLFPKVNDRPELLCTLHKPEKIMLFATSICLNASGKNCRHHFYLAGQDHIAHYNHRVYQTPYDDDAFSNPYLPWCKAKSTTPRIHDLDALADLGFSAFKVIQLEVFEAGWFRGEDIAATDWTMPRLRGDRRGGFRRRLRSLLPS